MKLLAKACTHLVECPSIFQSDDGKIIVRGRLVKRPTPNRAYPENDLGQWEADVEIPRELVEEAIRKLSQEPQEADETSKAIRRSEPLFACPGETSGHLEMVQANTEQAGAHHRASRSSI